MRWQPGTHAPNCSVTQYDGHTEGAVVDGKHAARFRWGGEKWQVVNRAVKMEQRAKRHHFTRIFVGDRVVRNECSQASPSLSRQFCKSYEQVRQVIVDWIWFSVDTKVDNSMPQVDRHISPMVTAISFVAPPTSVLRDVVFLHEP